jgi:hypothetical protein
VAAAAIIGAAGGGTQNKTNIAKLQTGIIKRNTNLAGSCRDEIVQLFWDGTRFAASFVLVAASFRVGMAI